MDILTLKLVSISHSNASVGDDIRIEIEALGTFFALNKKLPKRKTVEIQKDVVQILTAEAPSHIPVSIRIIERDPVFNDVGIATVTLPVSSRERQSKQTSHRIAVREWRGAYRKTAVFTVALQTEIRPATKYVLDVGTGWIATEAQDGGKSFSLPAHTKVSISRIDNREHFTVREGRERGRKASVKFQKGGSSFLGIRSEHRGPIHLVYSISQKTLRFDREVYQTIDYKNELWTPGLYDIEMPDFPHSGGRVYLKKAPHALTWFLVGHTGARYIHTGSRSAGCITLTEHDRWEKLYQVLIRARKGDSVSIGTLQVVA